MKLRYVVPLIMFVVPTVATGEVVEGLQQSADRGALAGAAHTRTGHVVSSAAWVTAAVTMCARC